MTKTLGIWNKCLCLLGLVAVLGLTACGDKAPESEEVEEMAEVVEEEAPSSDVATETEDTVEEGSEMLTDEDYHARQQAYLEENATKEGVMVTNSGLQYRVLNSAGSDVHPKPEDKVVVHYKGQFIDGVEFDSTSKGQPMDFPLNGVISGWTEGLQLMGVGDKFEFTIPSELGYGEKGYPGAIPGGATLVFEVELLDILSL